MSSPDLLSSTSPVSPADYHPRSQYQQEMHAQQPSNNEANHLAHTRVDAQDSNRHLKRSQIMSNTFSKKDNETTQVHTIRKYTFSHADAVQVGSTSISDIRSSDHSNTRNDKLNYDRESTYVNHINEGQKRPPFRDKQLPNALHTKTPEPPSFSVANKSTQATQVNSTSSMCPAELILQNASAANASHTNNTAQRDTAVSLQTNCMYGTVADDTESSYNPSPDIDSAITLESVSDDNIKQTIAVTGQKSELNDEDADRKDSNSSNITNVSSITTTSNISASSNLTESSLTSEDVGAPNVRRRSCTGEQFSLIENYPPKERRKLQNELENNSTGSDTSGSGPSPPPVRAPPSAALYRSPPSAKLSRQNSLVASILDVRHHKHTVSLSHLDDSRQRSAKPSKRAAITP